MFPTRTPKGMQEKDITAWQIQRDYLNLTSYNFYLSTSSNYENQTSGENNYFHRTYKALTLVNQILNSIFSLTPPQVLRPDQTK